MNQVGLWRVTTATASFTGGTAGSVSNGVITVGSANTQIEIDNALADYDNYKVVITGLTCATNNNAILLRLGTSTIRTDYRYGGTVTTISTGVIAASAANNTAEGLLIGFTQTVPHNYMFEMMAPNIAGRTNFISGSCVGNFATTNQGYDNSAVAYPSFVIRVSTGSMTGGTIRIYGYRD
jgi:hypothetical protein